MSELFYKQIAKRQFGTAKTAHAGKALIVDDSVTDLLGPYHLLHHLGYDVKVCFDGIDGLSRIENEDYKIIILDLSMPGMDGQAVINKVNEGRKASKRPPIDIIIYTGHDVTKETFSQFEYVNIIDIWQKTLCVSKIAEKLKLLKAA